MRTKPEDINSDIAELAERVRDADRRVRKMQFDLAAATQVYDQLSKAYRQLSDLADLHRQLPTIWGDAQERVQYEGQLPY